MPQARGQWMYRLHRSSAIDHHHAPPPRPLAHLASLSMSFPTPATRASIVFVADPAADLILKSSDGVWFPIRRVFLQAASEVFDGMLSTGTGSNADAKDPKTGLVVVQLDDKAAELDILLRFIDRDQSRVSKEGKPLSLGETMSYVLRAHLFGPTS